MKPTPLPDDWTPWTRRAQHVDPHVVGRVNEIVKQVEAEGDAALAKWSHQLDGHAARFLSDSEWNHAAEACPADVAQAIDGNLARIRAFHERQRPREDSFEVTPGVMLGRRPVPLDAVACYVPGGRAQYPSTVLMTVAPAAIAGVPRIVVTTPPTPDGLVHPAVAYAARAAGATHILASGGAHAVAALAHGTASIEPVQCIVGPGNAYVTAAKQLVADRVRIDSPAGPSELLVLADAAADPQRIAWDLLAQAEHDPDAQVILVTPDAALAAAVAEELDRLAPAEPRAHIIKESLRDHGAILVAPDLDAAIEFANAYAAEHLTIMTQDASRDAARITAAGSLFIGPHAPVSLGDYGSGTNHVLPTMGFAAQRGGLAVDDFMRWISWQSVTPEGLSGIAADISTLAQAEGLAAHASAVTRRLAS